MFRRSLWALPLALSAAVPAVADTAATSPSHSKRSQLIGAWSLIDAHTVRPNGELLPWFFKNGQGPRDGIIIYDRSGQMSGQIVGERKSIASWDEFDHLAVDERIKFLDSYYSYFGSYEVEEDTNTVVHHVRGSLLPQEIGAIYRRHFDVSGDGLTLTTPPKSVDGEMRFSRLIWQRFNPQGN